MSEKIMKNSTKITKYKLYDMEIKLEQGKK